MGLGVLDPWVFDVSVLNLWILGLGVLASSVLRLGSLGLGSWLGLGSLGPLVGVFDSLAFGFDR